MQKNNLGPIAQSSRLEIIDILRGWALLGVVLMNYSNYANYDSPLSKTDNLIDQVGTYIFAVKSWSLLSFLFGFGFAALYEKIKKANNDPNLFYLKRMGILFLFSIINSAFYSGDILHDYAWLGCILLLFINMKCKTLFVWGLIILLITPIIGAMVYNYLTPPANKELEKLLHEEYMSGHFFITLKRNLTSVYVHEIKNMVYTITVHVQMLGMMFLGLAAFKYHFFENLLKFKKQIRYICLNAFLATIIFIEIRLIFEKNNWDISKYFQMGWLRYDATLLFIISAICLLYLSIKNHLRVMGLFLYMGKMTLTNYLVQNFLIFFLFSGVGLGMYEKYSPKIFYLIALCLFILQAVFSRLWLNRFQFGPAEWLWRSLSYGKWIKNKKLV